MFNFNLMRDHVVSLPGVYEIPSFLAYQMGYLDREGARVYGFP